MKYTMKQLYHLSRSTDEIREKIYKVALSIIETTELPPITTNGFSLQDDLVYFLINLEAASDVIYQEGLLSLEGHLETLGFPMMIIRIYLDLIDGKPVSKLVEEYRKKALKNDIPIIDKEMIILTLTAIILINNDLPGVVLQIFLSKQIPEYGNYCRRQWDATPTNISQKEMDKLILGTGDIDEG